MHFQNKYFFVCLFSWGIVECLLLGVFFFMCRAPTLMIAQSAGTLEYADCTSAEWVRPLHNECPGYDSKLYLRVRLQPWSSRDVEYLFSAITPGFTLTRVGSPCQGPIYGSNRSVLPFNCVQTKKTDVKLNCQYYIAILETIQVSAYRTIIIKLSADKTINVGQ